MSYLPTPPEMTDGQLRALLAIAQAPMRREERTIADVKAELAARAVAGTPDWQSRVRYNSCGHP